MRYCRAVAHKLGRKKSLREGRYRMRQLFWQHRTKFGAIYLNQTGWKHFAAILGLANRTLVSREHRLQPRISSWLGQSRSNKKSPTPRILLKLRSQMRIRNMSAASTASSSYVRAESLPMKFLQFCADGWKMTNTPNFAKRQSSNAWSLSFV